MKTKDLLKTVFLNIPEDFTYSEVRFHVYNAIQKLENIEKKELNKNKQRKEKEIQEELIRSEVKKKGVPYYQSPFLLKQAFDTIDKMIATEQQKINSLQKVNKDGSTEDVQTIRG